MYENGVSELFQEMSLYAMSKLGDTGECIHLDSTSFHLHGEKYNDSACGELVHVNIETESKETKPRLNRHEDIPEMHIRNCSR